MTFGLMPRSRNYTADKIPIAMGVTGSTSLSAPLEAKLLGGLKSGLLQGFLQPKLDGWRFIADLQQGKYYSRRGSVFDPSPRIAADFEAMRRASPPGLRYIDGELCHLDGRDSIQSSLKENGSDTSALRFHAFDIVDQTLPFSQRYQLLQELMAEQHPSPSSGVAVVPCLSIRTTWSTSDVANAGSLKELFESEANHYVRDGFEGLVLRLDSVHTAVSSRACESPTSVVAGGLPVAIIV